jgi:anti-sigma regulatory factor (Ser/Thr protein kinase)/RimJ/RimL family protein N-acetyltransferase
MQNKSGLIMTDNTKDIVLSLPNDMQYLPLALSSISAAANIMGFNKANISKIELGAEEAITNVIKHAFDQEENARFDIILQPDTLGLKIIIKEKGIPFDPESVRPYKPQELSGDYSTKGLGLYLMKQFLDEVSFHNLGRAGKETHLYKYLNNEPIDKRLTKEEHEEVILQKKEEKVAPGSVSFHVRRLLPHEAKDISIGAYASYGYTYVLEHIYFPERVKEMNEKEELISFVAVRENDEIISHIALEIEEADPLTPQLGIAFTKPKYRGQGCLNVLTEACMDYAKHKKLHGIYARGVTTHPYSQKTLIRFHINDCALMVSSGVNREYKGITGQGQRESVVIHFRYMSNAPEFTIYPPEHHKDMIAGIYENIQAEVRFSAASDAAYKHSESLLKIENESINQVARIRVCQYGSDILDQIKKTLKTLCYERLETLYLFLKLADPMTAILCAEIEKTGFFFSGIMPTSGNNDMLMLQYLNNHSLDYEKIQIASTFGNKMKDYIRDHDPNLL